METVDSEADNETWNLDRRAALPGSPVLQVRMSSRFESGRALLPLPMGTARLTSFPANQLRRNELGAVHAQLAVDWANYVAEAASGHGLVFAAYAG
jgi:hypothetical protein